MTFIVPKLLFKKKIPNFFQAFISFTWLVVCLLNLTQFSVLFELKFWKKNAMIADMELVC